MENDRRDENGCCGGNGVVLVEEITSRPILVQVRRTNQVYASDAHSNGAKRTEGTVHCTPVSGTCTDTHVPLASMDVVPLSVCVADSFWCPGSRRHEIFLAPAHNSIFNSRFTSSRPTVLSITTYPTATYGTCLYRYIRQPTTCNIQLVPDRKDRVHPTLFIIDPPW